VGELFSPTIIRRAIDEAIVRDWYGIAPSVINVLSNNNTNAIEIDDRIYVRSSQLSSVPIKERNQLVAQGSIDAEASYVFSLDPDRDKKLAIIQEFPEAKHSDTYGVIPSSLLKNLRSDQATIIRAADSATLLRYALLLLVVLLIVLVATFAMTWYTNQISTLIMKDMRLELYQHVIEQSLSYLSRQPVGRLVTRLTSDIEVISQFFSDCAQRVYQGCIDNGRSACCAADPELETWTCRYCDAAVLCLLHRQLLESKPAMLLEINAIGQVR